MAKDNAAKPYIVMTTVKAGSGSYSYEIRTSLQDGSMYCTCPGFFMHGRSCKHMDAYKANPTFQPGPPSNAPHPVIARPTRKRKRKAPAITPTTALVAELARLNLSLTMQQAGAIVRKLAPMMGEPKAAPAADAIPATSSIGEHGGARVIIIPED